MDIDDSGFELGMPTRMEVLQHQCERLCNENDQLRHELSKAKRHISQLVEINQDLNRTLADTRKRFNDVYVDYVQECNRRYGNSFKTWGEIGMKPTDAGE